jgi:predicted transcriptional regulator|tara:strand:- start:2076 stop:2435 length:360 start_codon:yes stop_codon:yes gene_type:complete
MFGKGVTMQYRAPYRQLSEADVLRIKELLFRNKMSQPQIAMELGCSQSTVSNIFRGYRYQDIAWPDGSIGGPCPTMETRGAKKQSTKQPSNVAEEVARRLEEDDADPMDGLFAKGEEKT